MSLNKRYIDDANRLRAGLAKNAELTQKLADNDLAFEHAQEVILAHERENAELKQMAVSLELEAESRGWQLAHDKRPCGHPRAFWQDENWPASEENYNPETRSGDPPIKYSCVMCSVTLANRALELQRDTLRVALESAIRRIGTSPWTTELKSLLARTDADWRQIAQGKDEQNG